MSARVKESSFTTSIEGDDGEDMDVVVFYTVSGRHIPAKFYGDDAHPEEFPEIDITKVEDMNGVDVTELADIDALTTEAEENLGNAADDRWYED